MELCFSFAFLLLSMLLLESFRSKKGDKLEFCPQEVWSLFSLSSSCSCNFLLYNNITKNNQFHFHFFFIEKNCITFTIMPYMKDIIDEEDRS